MLPDYWRRIATHVRNNLAAHQTTRVWVPPQLHPAALRQWFVEDAGIPAAPCGDWRLRLADGSGLHVQDLGNGWLDVHWDRVDPTSSLAHRIEHGIQDAPGVFIGLVALAFAAIGAAASRDKRAPIQGALWGAAASSLLCAL